MPGGESDRLSPHSHPMREEEAAALRRMLAKTQEQLHLEQEKVAELCRLHADQVERVADLLRQLAALNDSAQVSSR